MSSRIHTPATSSAGRRLAGGLAAAVLAGAVLMLGAAPALAHDELVSSDPADGSTVDALPDQITLTFNEAVLDDEGATVVRVTDASGAEVQSGAPIVSDAVVTQAITPRDGADGVYTVAWKIVSDDGHPVSDEFSFTVAGAASPTPTPTPTAGATTVPEPTPSPTSTTAPASDTGVPPWVWAIVGVVVAGVLGAVVYLLVSRARRQAEDERLRAAAAGSEPPADR